MRFDPLENIPSPHFADLSLILPYGGKNCNDTPVLVLVQGRVLNLRYIHRKGRIYFMKKQLFDLEADLARLLG